MKKVLQNSRGQISIFFATTILVIITFLAFVVNIGVFVKAKINLQNAVDASAFAGASVQARQLTNIAYLNWEMRNVYKEWMFKYYVLGNLNINDVAGNPGTNTSFRMQSYQTGTKNAEDKYNFPSVCIDFSGAGATALCRNYIIPGLPRFSPTNVGGMDETTNSIIDTLTNEKSKDCALRSQLNFLTATLWAYNVLSPMPNALQLAAPEVAADRKGAFPAAFELAIRMRNLEAQVNKEPMRSGVCISSGSPLSSEFCQTSINDFLQSDQSASNERINKAFYSGYRNLGSNEDTELRDSFTLREIPPREYYASEAYSLSNLLIPDSAAGERARRKYYLDLKLMTLNLASFYTMFNQTKGDVNVQGISATTEGQCASTKTGLPVPGYPLGFIKNPDVLTYYAVEGKAKFVGLFNPFDVTKDNGITLTAYSAAKPFGGRIGPMLFDVMKNETSVFPRVDSGTSKYLSSAFVSGIDSSFFIDQYGNDVPAGTYAPGAPLPLDLSSGTGFWQKDQSSAVGGWLDGNQVVFGIPNIIYDYPNDSGATSPNLYLNPGAIQVIKPKNNEALGTGLYNGQMFTKFANNLNNRGANIRPKDIADGIYSARAATKWEAANYLIPTTEAINSALSTDSFGVVGGSQSPLDSFTTPNGRFNLYQYAIYAPLFSDDPANLYKTPADIITTLNQYLQVQKLAIQKYLKSMNTAAAAIFQNNISGASGANIGRESAKYISDIDDSFLTSGGDPTNDAALPSCNSITGKFIYFYYGPKAIGGDINLLSSGAGCGAGISDPRDGYLSGLLEKYFSNNDNNLGEYYLTTLTTRSEPSENKFNFSAYMPGAQNDAQANNGVQKNILNSNTENMWRNFYSSKFITLKSLLSGGDNFYSEVNHRFPIHSGGNNAKTGGTTAQRNYANPLNIDQLNIDLGDLNH